MSLFLTSVLWFLYHRVLRRRASTPPGFFRHHVTRQPVKVVD